MAQLWIPPGAPQPRRTAVPDRSIPIRLRDGRILRPDPVWLERLLPQLDRASKDAGAWVCRRANGECAALATMDHGPHGPLLHVSVSCQGHLPDWETIRLVKLAFFGNDIDAAMILPQEADYVNVNPNVLHITELPVAWGIR